MSEVQQSTGEPTAERDNTRLYVGVIAAEVVVLLAIWLVQQYFGS